MTDKQIIETLAELKSFCLSYSPCYCSLCKFYVKDRGCQISETANLLSVPPARWDMEEIERIINE